MLDEVAADGARRIVFRLKKPFPLLFRALGPISGACMRLIGPTDILAPAAPTHVAADMFRRLGMNMDFALSDWGTVIQRRTSRAPVEKGGWSVLCTASSGFDAADPAAHSMIRGNGPPAGLAGRRSRGWRRCATPGSKPHPGGPAAHRRRHPAHRA